ncbi:MAG TPA: kynureninase, partial [Chryseolinea sp.]
MMVSFYNPSPQRYKIITEAGAFPSDQYAFESQIKFHGYDPGRSLIELKPRDGEHILRTEDIVASIKAHANELALVIFGGVQYYTGQLFDLKTITEAGHAAGANVGFDLAHAIGNVPLSLHDDDVDFAVWCSYKYLNSGPGSIAGIFVHERHAQNFDLPRFAGWWGHNEKERFLMEKGFKPMPGADGWQLSNVPVFQGAAHIAALEIFQQTTITALRKKSLLLTGYLEFLLNDFDPDQKYYRIITPRDPAQRGCQLSLLLQDHGKKIFKGLLQGGVILDWREPNVIRLAPVPLYNSFQDVFRFVEILKTSIKRYFK